MSDLPTSNEKVWSDDRIKDELRDYDPSLPSHHVAIIFNQALALIEHREAYWEQFDHVPKGSSAPEPADELYALLVRRGYAQHEAHAIAFGDKLAVLSSSPPPPAGLNKVLEPEKYGNGYRVSLIFLSEENAAAAYLELDRPELTKGAEL
jgi:hypothetical protein